MSSPSTTTPLLSGQTESTQSETPTTAPASSLDDIIERSIGDFGWAQFLQVCLVSMTRVFDAQQTFITVFADADPTWHCTSSSSSSCKSEADLCQLPINSWAWDMPTDTSIVSDWSLECASSVIRGLPASSFFLGCLASGFVLPHLPTPLPSAGRTCYSCHASSWLWLASSWPPPRTSGCTRPSISFAGSGGPVWERAP